jgi:hypothetical protein
MNELEPNMEELEVFEEHEEITGGLLTNQQYEIPEDADAFVDTEKGKIIKKEDMAPFDIIKTVAQQNGLSIPSPKKNCKHCHGRGYEGKDSKTQMPIPCRCLFREREDSDKIQQLMEFGKSHSRDKKRRFIREFKKDILKQAKANIKHQNNPKPKELEESDIDNILKEYIKLSSLKQTAISVGLSLTQTKKVIKENKEKLEEMKR